MKKLSLLVWVNVLVTLGAFNWIIQQKEELWENGRVVLLEIGPKDPLSLMQGAYMALFYKISNDIQKQVEESEREGIAVVGLDGDSVGTFRRRYKEGEPLAEHEQLLHYKVRSGGWNRVRVAAESFFFQAEFAKEYERAKFAELRVSADGHTLLVALRDEERRLIDPQKE